MTAKLVVERPRVGLDRADPALIAYLHLLGRTDAEARLEGALGYLVIVKSLLLDHLRGSFQTCFLLNSLFAD